MVETHLRNESRRERRLRRSRIRFRMKLHGKDRALPMSHPLIRAIVCVEEPWLPFLRQRFLVHGETHGSAR